VAVLPDLEIYLGVGSLVDVDQEISRLEEELSAIEKNILKSESKLKNEKFVNKAPDEIVQKEKDRLKESNMRKDRILQNIQSLRGE
jgi:valyl-tRNA synthetase